MKTMLKTIGIVFFGLLVAVIIYPILHEGGHSLVAMAVGAEVISFELFPLPNIMCNISRVSSWGSALIGIGGMLFPLIASLVLRPKSFWLWYCNTLIRGVSILALGITVTATIMFVAGKPVANEDITSVLNAYGNAGALVIVMAIPLIALVCLLIVREKPVKRIETYFDI